jgi:drug/metabolite transporter (DMT)-like permease
MIFWALSFIWYKEAYIYYKPLSLVFLRLFISSILLFTIAIASRSLKFIRKNNIKDFLLLALCEPFFYFLGESYGIQYIPSPLASLIVSFIPLFASIAAWLFFKEKLSIFNITGIIISIAGILFVIFNKGLSTNISFKGVLLMFVAVISATGYSLMVKKVSEKYNSITVVVWQNIFGALYFIPLVFIFEYNHIINISFNYHSIKPLLKLAIFASSLAFIFFTFAIKRIGIAKATVFTNLIPILTSIFAFFMLSESFNNAKLIGIALVITGLYISQIKKNKAIQ